jgi:hypothetical protein
MNAERLHAIVLAVRDELLATSVVTMMQQLRDSLQNQVNAPQEPSYQQQVSATLQQLSETLAEAPSNSFPPAWQQTLEEHGVAGLLGEPLAETVQEIFERNQITASVALSEIQELTAQLEALATAVDQLLAGLSHFDVGSEELELGEAEIAVLIPRPAVDDELHQLGDEFIELERLLGPFVELATGSRPPLKVASISSTDFGVYIDMVPEAAAFLAVAVERVVALYKSLLEIRRLRQELRDQGVDDDELTGVDAHANSHMAKGIDAAVDDLIEQAAVRDAGRRNELRIELRLSLNALANRIDQGYNIDVRAAPAEAEDEAEEPASQPSSRDEALRQIRELSPRLRFINRTGQPILSLPESTGPDEATETGGRRRGKGGS